MPLPLDLVRRFFRPRGFPVSATSFEFLRSSLSIRVSFLALRVVGVPLRDFKPTLFDTFSSRDRRCRRFSPAAGVVSLPEATEAPRFRRGRGDTLFDRVFLIFLYKYTSKEMQEERLEDAQSLKRHKVEKKKRNELFPSNTKSEGQISREVSCGINEHHEQQYEKRKAEEGVFD